jgi:hypothetical protein
MVVSGAQCMSLSYNEVSIVNNQSWISIHAYVLVDWEQVLLLLSLERLTEGSTAAHINKIIINAVLRDGSVVYRDFVTVT